MIMSEEEANNTWETRKSEWIDKNLKWNPVKPE